jgi:hypothetical protein
MFVLVAVDGGQSVSSENFPVQFMFSLVFGFSGSFGFLLTIPLEIRYMPHSTVLAQNGWLHIEEGCGRLVKKG